MKFLFKKGISKFLVIHFPEGAYSCDKNYKFNY